MKARLWIEPGQFPTRAAPSPLPDAQLAEDASCAALVATALRTAGSVFRVRPCAGSGRGCGDEPTLLRSFGPGDGRCCEGCLGCWLCPSVLQLQENVCVLPQDEAILPFCLWVQYLYGKLVKLLECPLTSFGSASRHSH